MTSSVAQEAISWNACRPSDNSVGAIPNRTPTANLYVWGAWNGIPKDHEEYVPNGTIEREGTGRKDSILGRASLSTGCCVYRTARVIG